MIKGTQLIGRAVIDMEAATRLGKIKEIIVQRDGERVGGFVVVHGETIIGTGGTRRTIPASAMHAIGPDAITVRGSAMKNAADDLGKLPRMSDIIGHKMVTRSGRLLGSIEDLLINGTDGTIVGYVVGEGVRGKVENFFNPQRSRTQGYVRADADLQVGNELIVVPDDALIETEPATHEREAKAGMQTTGKVESRRWGDQSSAEPARSSIWTRGTDPATRDSSQISAEPRLKSETARPVENNLPANAAEAASETSTSLDEDEAVPAAPRDRSPQ